MTNRDKFKEVFGLYATEVWSMPESDFLAWANAESNEMIGAERLKNNIVFIEQSVFMTTPIEEVHQKIVEDIKKDGIAILPVGCKTVVVERDGFFLFENVRRKIRTNGK